ncbi:MAG: DPP IV N-terminal domain-containing protein [Myxococcota bacterium]
MPIRLTLLVAALALTACETRDPSQPIGPTPTPTTTKLAPKPIDTTFLAQYAATNKFTLGRPTAFKVNRAGTLVYFLRSPARGFSRDLYVYDVTAKTEQVLTTASQLLAGTAENLSAEEKARRERMRSTARGIASFELSKDGKRLLVPLSGKLYVVEADTAKAKELTDAGGYANDPTLSPLGDKIACVRNGDVFVIDIASNQQTRLTNTATDTISNGLPEFVAQEEMDRFRGYWWSPDGKSIVYQQTDTRGMDKSYIADPSKPDQPPQSWPYPRPGRNNASVRVGVVDVRGGATRWINWDSGAFPYLVSVTWTEDAPLLIAVQNRAQTDLKLYEVELTRGSARELLTEHDDAWVNIAQSVPRFYEKGRKLLWISEENGAPVLEVRETSGAMQKELTKAELGLHELVHIDEAAGHAYVLASDDATDKRLFRVPLAGGDATPVASARAKESAAFTDGAPVFVHSQTLEDGDVRDVVRKLDGSEVGVIASVAEQPGAMPKIELTRVTGHALNAAIIRPRDFAAGHKYPVIVHVYAGPHNRIVDRMPRSYFLDQWIADNGFVVVAIDNRGTPGRGRAFERVIKNDLITVALADQVAGLQALLAKYPEMDGNRVGIYGWSFGGYASAHAVMQRPDVYKAGVAGAPVTDWRDYDTHYTERYMGLPDANAVGYAKTSVLTYVEKLERPLLVVHGTADDNVYFSHSLKLGNLLFRAGKRFEFLPLLNFTHMVPEPEVTTRLYEKVVDFFQRSL